MGEDRSLPVLSSTSKNDGSDLRPGSGTAKRSPVARIHPAVLLVVRITVLLSIVWCIRTLHTRAVIARLKSIQDNDLLTIVKEVLPNAEVLQGSSSKGKPAAPTTPSAESAVERERTLVSSDSRETPTREVLDANAVAIGWLTKTMPTSQQTIGFSGPSDIVLVFDTDDRLVRAELLHSGDTIEHVQQVLDSGFLEQFYSQTAAEIEQSDVDGVSGATLTSLAMADAIRQTLRRNPVGEADDRPTTNRSASLKFRQPPSIDAVSKLFAAVTTIEQIDEFRWIARDSSGNDLGTFLRTAPDADNVIGYQGPSDVLIEIASGDRVGRLALDYSYDNEPYVDYVRDDRVFPKEWQDKSLEEAIEVSEGVEGVSGATMTSLAVSDSVKLTLETYAEQQERLAQEDKLTDETLAPQPNDSRPVWNTVWRNRWRLLSCGLIAVLLIRHFSKSTKSRPVSRHRDTVLRWAVVTIFGVLNGDLLSMALFIGWSQSGLPTQSHVWLAATPLMLMAGIAFIAPVASGKNLYCARYCAQGALQQLLRRQRYLHVILPRRILDALRYCSPFLLVLALLVPVLSISVSTVNLEPFDAWLWRVSGFIPIVIFGVSILASLCVPMAYCRFGCPTGRLLDHVRYSRGTRWNSLDSLLLVVLIVAAAKCLFVAAT